MDKNYSAYIEQMLIEYVLPAKYWAVCGYIKMNKLDFQPNILEGLN